MKNEDSILYKEMQAAFKDVPTTVLFKDIKYCYVKLSKPKC